MITEIYIKEIAASLKHLLKEVVFVGGAVVNLYSSDEAVTEIRQTDDIDCVVKTLLRSDYNNFEKEIRKLGFKNDLSENAPICRYIYNGIKVDFMPTEGIILGFENKWYKEGFNNAIIHNFEDGTAIRIFAPEYFLASKLDAFWDRGRKDMRLSKDFEDIIFLLNSRKELLYELKESDASVLEFIKDKMNYFISNTDTDEGIIAVLPYGSGRNRAGYIKKIMSDIISL